MMSPHPCAQTAAPSGTHLLENPWHSPGWERLSVKPAEFPGCDPNPCGTAGISSAETSSGNSPCLFWKEPLVPEAGIEHTQGQGRRDPRHFQLPRKPGRAEGDAPLFNIEYGTRDYPGWEGTHKDPGVQLLQIYQETAPNLPGNLAVNSLRAPGQCLKWERTCEEKGWA